jgi:spermidine synthase
MPAAPAHVVLHVLFFCSGASGLIYEVVWVREFGYIFGNTVHSAALVVAVFMLGLGVGGYAVGRWADRRAAAPGRSLVKAYGCFELGIGLWGLLISLLLPHLGAFSALISSYVREPGGWYVMSATSYLWRYLVAVLLVGPATFVMGGTLTLLIREVVSGHLSTAGWRVATLYGVNTAGAALGCFLTDALLVPVAGLRTAQMVAVLLNVLAAAGAFQLAKHPAPEPRATQPVQPAADPAAPLSLPLVALALALAGFAAMGMEILWFRHMTLVLGGFRAVFSLLLTVVLVGIWLGSVAGGWLHRRFGHAALWFALAQAAFVVSALAGLAATSLDGTREAERAWTESFAAAPGWVRATVGVWLDLRPLLREAAVPAVVMGMTFPLGNAIVQRSEAAVGGRAGALYLANTVGAVVGSLACGFVLLPLLGMQRVVAVLALGATLGVVPLLLVSVWFTRSGWLERAALGGAIAAALAAVALWLTLPAGYLLSRAQDLLTPGAALVTMHEGINEVVAVTEVPGGGRALWTNGHPMSSTTRLTQRYMRAFAHLPLLSLERPERVLVICFGVGNTAHAASLHPSVRRLDVVDISRQVLQHADYFAAANGGVLRDPRVSVFVNDGRQHVRMQPAATYDLITMEAPPVALAGVGSLYSREFYELVRARLRPGGYVTQWLPVAQVPPETALSMIGAFLAVFPQAVLLSGTDSELVLMGVNGPRIEIDPARVAARLRESPAVQRDLDRVDLGTLTEMVGTFLASADALAEASRLARAATDDRPIQEYGARSSFSPGRVGAPVSIFRVDGVSAWCPTCFADGKPAATVEGLDTYLAILDSVYRDPAFQQRGLRLPEGGAAGEVIARNPYLRGFIERAREVASRRPAG